LAASRAPIAYGQTSRVSNSYDANSGSDIEKTDEDNEDHLSDEDDGDEV
jgi:hypothetical protein